MVTAKLCKFLVLSPRPSLVPSRIAFMRGNTAGHEIDTTLGPESIISMPWPETDSDRSDATQNDRDTRLLIQDSSVVS